MSEDVKAKDHNLVSGGATVGKETAKGAIVGGAIGGLGVVGTITGIAAVGVGVAATIAAGPLVGLAAAAGAALAVGTASAVAVGPGATSIGAAIGSVIGFIKGTGKVSDEKEQFHDVEKSVSQARAVGRVEGAHMAQQQIAQEFQRMAEARAAEEQAQQAAAAPQGGHVDKVVAQRLANAQNQSVGVGK